MGDNTFTPRVGTTDRGNDYEDLMVANLILKLITDDSVGNFKLSSNDDKFGAFGDVVLEVESTNQTKIYALQFEHVTKEKSLTRSGLMKSRENFNPKKYFEDFKQLKLPANVQFCLFTNLKLEIPDGEIIDGGFKIVKIPHESLLNISSEGHCYKFEVVEREYKSFFDKFFLYVNQATVDSLRKDTLNKFQEMFCCHESIFDQYFAFITKWSVSEDEKIKLNKILMKRLIALRLLSSSIEPFCFSNLAVVGQPLVFKNAISEFKVTILERKNCNRIKEIYRDVKNEIQDISEINTIGNKYQIISKHVKDVSQLDEEESTAIFWLLGKCPLIVGESEATIKAINLCRDETFILLTDDSSKVNLQSCTIFRNLSDIDRDSEIYTKIVETFKFSIQGKEKVTLRASIDDCEDFRSIITTNELVQMMDESFTIGGEKEVLPVPYIDRFVSNSMIQYKFLNQGTQDTLIVISCREKFDEIKTHISSFNIIKVEHYLNKEDDFTNSSINEFCFNHLSGDKEFENDIYINQNLCSQLEFDEICKRNSNKRNYHHFQVIDGDTLEWVRSKGDVAELDEYRYDGHFIEETKLFDLDTENNIEIVCADPGMGKSVLAKNITNYHSSELWTVLIYVNEHCSFLDEKNHDAHHFIEYILNKKDIKKEDFKAKLLNILSEQSRLLFIWDGLDEVSNEKLQTVMNIIDELSKKGLKQLITSRTNLRKTLESRFKVLSRTIQPFDDTQQTDYIKQRLTLCETDPDNTIMKIKKNIEMAKYNDILSIPLHCFMLTELFHQDREKYKNLLDQIFSVADLYRHFVDEKFSVYYREKADLKDANYLTKRMFETQTRTQKELYEKAALRLFFPNEFLKELHVNCDAYLNTIQEEGDCFGFITGVTREGAPKFLHHSYAEYFAATYLYKNHTNIPELKNIIFDERYRNIRFLFDLMFAKDHPLHIAVLYRNCDELLKYQDQLNCKDLGGRNPLHLACSWGQRYPLLTSRKIYRKYIIDDATISSVDAETSEYRKILEVLCQNCDPYEMDGLFNLNSFGYADKSLCLLPILTLSTVHKVTRNDLDNFIDIATILYYSVKFDFSAVFGMFKQVPYIETRIQSLSLLHLSANYNSTTCLRHLLSQAIYRRAINHRNKFNQSAILIACARGYTEIVRWLIDAKADVTFRELFMAYYNGHVDVVRLLIDYGANVNGAAKKGLTLMQVAAFNGHSEVLRLIINAGADVNGANDKNRTPLFLACLKGHLDVVSLLIDCGANVNAATQDDHTPIYALSEIVRLPFITKSDHKCFTPLYIACAAGHTEVVQLLVKFGANVNDATIDGATPIRIASFKGHSEIIRILIDAKAEVNVTGNDSYTPLHRACQEGHIEVVQLLINCGANVNAATNDGDTPIRVASFFGHSEIIRKLIDAKADVNVTDSEGCPPLYLACQQGQVEVVQVLVEFGADVNAVVKDDTPMRSASFYGHPKIVQILIDAKTDVNYADNEGSTPLLLACQEGHVEVVRILIKFGANVNAAAKDGYTPMHRASFNGNSGIVRLLNNAKADLHVVDAEGYTPLHLACLAGHVGVVRLLIEFGANVNAAAKNGDTPMRMASFKDHSEIVRILYDTKADAELTDHKIGRVVVSSRTDFNSKNVKRCSLS